MEGVKNHSFEFTQGSHKTYVRKNEITVSVIPLHVQYLLSFPQ